MCVGSPTALGPKSVSSIAFEVFAVQRDQSLLGGSYSQGGERVDVPVVEHGAVDFVDLD